MQHSNVWNSIFPFLLHSSQLPSGPGTKHHEYEQHLNIMIKVNIYYITKGITIPTSHLKFGSEAMVFDLHFTHLIMNHCFDKCLNSKLKISCGKQNVSSDVLMNESSSQKNSQLILRQSCIPRCRHCRCKSHYGHSGMQWSSQSTWSFHIFTILQTFTFLLYLLSPHDRVKKMWKGPQFSNIAFSSILLTLQYLD